MGHSNGPVTPSAPQPEPEVHRPSWPALLLGLIPFIAMCFTVGWWDRVYPLVAGLPFNLFWLMAWILLTPLCMWGAYRFEQRRTAARSDGGKEGGR